MNIITHLHNVRDAVADDAAVKAWCQSNYSQDHKVYVGVDTRKPPGADDYPLVHLYPVSKAEGYSITRQGIIIGATCGIHDSTMLSTGKANVVEYRGVSYIDELRNLIRAAILSVDYGAYDPDINTEFETIDFFPFFLANMEITFSGEYTQGGTVFD